VAAQLDTGPPGKLKAAARALYSAPPQKDAQAAWGIPAKYIGVSEAIEVWPDNWPAVTFFNALSGGAWNVGPGGPLGIRPEAYREIRLGLGVTGQQWRDLFPDVMVMEEEALKTMREQAKK
jgi:hypothetical protein